MGGTMYGDTNWGGSFWHHGITKAKVKADFHRRIDRMLGRGEVPANKPRVFVRAVNCTQELNDIWKMRGALRRTLHGCKVHVLVLIDCQPTAGAIRVRETPTRTCSSIESTTGCLRTKALPGPWRA